ncbi:hypothetical protein A2U01_0013107 [Trifolium medium]|uniref:Uncharacterized protein n=1 Tax=Trifolium medium TaxID=97028 RepID=A0A392MXY3_9FABA|nr:hypothetical protein [Trifolium medium]
MEEGSSALITKATLITSVPTIASKKKKTKTSTVKKGTSMPISDSPSASFNVPFGTVRNDDPSVVESVHVLSSKVVGSDPLSSPTKVVVDSVVCSPKETLPESDVVPDVSTSLSQPGQYVETIQDNPHIESEYESSSENENSQNKMVSDDDGEKILLEDVFLFFWFSFDLLWAMP